MSYLEGALPSMEKSLSTAAELGGKKTVAESVQAALKAGGGEHVLGIDPNELNEPARIGFINGIVNHLEKQGEV
jgi:hypothetical protein